MYVHFVWHVGLNEDLRDAVQQIVVQKQIIDALNEDSESQWYMKKNPPSNNTEIFNQLFFFSIIFFLLW